MSWSLSRFRTGDLVEVRGKQEILATLDADGCVGGMPFMPEMLQFCGRQFRVGAVAHKTCDTIKPVKGLRLQSTVHLAGLRCDGSAHGGCQAACYLFWNDAWLKAADADGYRPDENAAVQSASSSSGINEARLLECTRAQGSTDPQEPIYSCQATRLLEATEPLPWWDIRQYVYDVATRNRSAGEAARVLALASLAWLFRRIPYGYRAARAPTTGPISC